MDCKIIYKNCFEALSLLLLISCHLHLERFVMREIHNKQWKAPVHMPHQRLTFTWTFSLLFISCKQASRLLLFFIVIYSYAYCVKRRNSWAAFGFDTQYLHTNLQLLSSENRTSEASGFCLVSIWNAKSLLICRKLPN